MELFLTGILIVALILAARLLLKIGRESHRLGKLFDELETVLESWNPNNDRISDGLLDEINTKFSEQESTRSFWSTFRSSLIQSDKCWRRTTDAAEHFHSSELIDPALWMDFSRHVPGILTGLGIICTFNGMKTGLDTASTALKKPAASAVNGSQSEQEHALTEMTQGLLNQIGPAITLSLCAVGAAIAFLFLERLLYSRVNGKLHKLQRLLDRKFPKITESYLLEQIRDHSQQSMVSLKSNNTDFAVLLENAIKKAMEPAFDRQTESLNQSNAELSKQLVELGEHFQRALETLNTNAAEASTKTMNDLVEKFQTTLTAGGESQLKEMLGSIEGVKELLSDQRIAQSNFVESISAASSHVLKSVQEFPGSVEKLSRAVRQASDDMERLLGSVESPIRQLQALSSSFVHQTETLTGLSSRLSQASDSLKDGSTTLADGLRQSEAGRLQTERALTLVAGLGQAVDTYQKGLSQVVADTRRQLEELKMFVQEFNSQTSIAFSDMREGAEDYRAAFHETAKGFLEEVSDALSKGVGSLSGAIEDLAGNIDELSGIATKQ